MDTSPIYQTLNSREMDGFDSDLQADAIETANTYIRNHIPTHMSPEERIVAMQDLADELSQDSGNMLIVSALRERISLEKAALELQLNSAVV